MVVGVFFGWPWGCLLGTLFRRPCVGQRCCLGHETPGDTKAVTGCSVPSKEELKGFPVGVGCGFLSCHCDFRSCCLCRSRRSSPVVTRLMPLSPYHSHPTVPRPALWQAGDRCTAQPWVTRGDSRALRAGAEMHCRAGENCGEPASRLAALVLRSR